MDASLPSNLPRIASALLAALTTGGTTYAFGLYGTALKEHLELTQEEIETISTAFFFAGLFSWVPGMATDRMGVRFTQCLGGAGGASSLLVYWAVARQFLWLPHAFLTPVLSILSILIFLSNALVIGAVFKTIVDCCSPSSKGTIVGIAKGYCGLGSGVYAVLFQALKLPEETNLNFLPLAATVVFACTVPPGLFFLPPQWGPKAVGSERLRDDVIRLYTGFLYLSMIGIAIMVVASVVSSLLGDDAALQKREYGKVVLLLVIWLAPILALVVLEPPQVDDNVESITMGITTTMIIEADPLAQPRPVIETTPLLGDKPKETKYVDPGDGEMGAPIREEKNLVEMLETPMALVMLWTCTLLVGAGTLETNHMGGMARSLGLPKAVTPACLALFSVAQSGARVVTGALSDAALTMRIGGFGIPRGIPRPYFLLVSATLTAIAQYILATTSRQAGFVIGAIMSGIAFGMVWPLMVLIVGEIFGNRNLAGNYMFFDGFTCAAGTLFLSKLVAQAVYVKHIDEDIDPNNCYGTECFEWTHRAATFFALSCVVTSMALIHLSRRFYIQGPVTYGV